MEYKGESRIDECCECVVRDRDFSKKKVFPCNFCDKWLCEKHIEPRVSFIPNFNPTNYPPQIKVLYDQEYRRQGGHPDWNFSRKKFEGLDIEEKTRNELIKQALDRMMNPEGSFEEDTDANRQKRIDMILTQEREFYERIRKENKKEGPKNERTGKEKCLERPKTSKNTITYGNKYGYHFSVPEEIYSVEPFRERLNCASTLAEAENIIRAYHTQALHKMMNPEKQGIEMEADYQKDTDKTVEIPLKEESNLIGHPEKVFVGYTKTVGNIHNHNYIVPTRIYYDEQYRKRLDNAETLAEVELIIRDYDKHHRTEQGDK